MKTYYFTVYMIGTGENEEDAWSDAIDNFCLDPGEVPSDKDTTIVEDHKSSY